MRRSRRSEALLALMVFVVSFVPRAVYPVSRPTQWYTRSVQFIHDVGRGAWRETVYSEHPGVTTMWLAGTALRVAGVTPEARPDGPYVDPASLTARESAIGVLPLAFATAALVALTFGMLLRLFSPLAALSGSVLVALDPFFLANSKVLHVDGLLAAFMITSAVSLLVYLRERRTRWVVLSGTMGGLALLTKSPALFLLPYTVLGLGVGAVLRRGAGWRRAMLGVLGWLLLALLVYVALYPAMWVDPIGTVRAVYTRAAMRVAWAHPSPIFFLGNPVSDDPGPAYYPVTWACKLTALVAVLAVVALLYAAFDGWQSCDERVSVGLLLAFGFFFTVQMTLGAKKMPRYLLPAFPAADILAGVGLAWWARRISARAPPLPKAAAALVVPALVLQGAISLSHHPYYGTHFNELVGARSGIGALSTQWQGEGLDIVARVLNRQPGPRARTVGSQMASLFAQYYEGTTVQVTDVAGLYVFGINGVMREEGTLDGRAWDFYGRRTPETMVSFGSTAYAWAYTVASGPEHVLDQSFEPGVQLVGYDIAPPPYEPGQNLRLQLYWLAPEPLEADYTVFVHLLNSEGHLVAQVDRWPVRGSRPTSGWKPGETIVDPYDLDLPPDLPPGRYAVALGLYHWPELTRLPAYSSEGARLDDDVVNLEVLPVASAPAEPGVWAARVLGLVVLGSAVAAGSRRVR